MAKKKSKTRKSKSSGKATLIYVTCPDIGMARKISIALIEEKLAACTNILPQMESHYRWKGRVHQDNEVVLIVKSAASKFSTIAERIRALHSYEIPCVLALPIEKGSPEYLNWIKSEVSG